MKVFVDTNVLIDYLGKREEFYDNAKKIFALGLLGKQELVISALSVANTMYIAHKYGHTKVRDGLKKVYDFLSVVDYTATIAKDAIDIGWKDYEDATQFLMAKNASCDCIVTRNGKDFKKSELPIYSPEDFLKIAFQISKSQADSINLADKS